VSFYSSIRPGLQTTDGEDKSPAGENLQVFADEAWLRLAEGGAMLRTLVTSRPALALGAALAAGAVVGWLIKRR
jgi:hypothetical protein